METAFVDSLAIVSSEKKQSSAESNKEERSKKVKGSCKRRKRKKKKKEKDDVVSNNVEEVGKIGGDVESDPCGLVSLAKVAILDVRSRTVEVMKKNDKYDVKAKTAEVMKKNDEVLERFFVSCFENTDIQAMKDDMVECIYESLAGGLGFFRFKKRGLIESDDGFSAQISQGIHLSCPPFDTFSMVVPVLACKFKDINNTIQNIGDNFNQLRYIVIENHDDNNSSAIMVKVSVKRN